mmetsp:Transcript_120236/g.345633  ORF Transcript_120236/g.345633 Transcript_120236/m.345633 type:complete len:339 (+) Transcript_120236:1155-2171(+)
MPSFSGSAMQKSIGVSRSTMIFLKFWGISKHSWRSMCGQAICQAFSNAEYARSQACRSDWLTLSSTLPTLSSPAFEREMRPLKRLMTKECHSKSPTRRPSAGSTGNNGLWSTVHSTGNAACAEECWLKYLCNVSKVTGERNAQSCGISASRLCLGKSRTSAASLSSATNFPSSVASPHLRYNSGSWFSRSFAMRFRYLISTVSSHLFRLSNVSFSQFSSGALAAVPLGSSRVSKLILRRRLWRPTAKSSVLLDMISTISFQSRLKCSQMYLASEFWCMLHKDSRFTKWSKILGIGSPAWAAKPQSMEPCNNKRMARAELPRTSRKTMCRSSRSASGNM